MQHLVSFSLAPVIVVMDDRGDPVQTLIIGPASWLLYLPGLLYTVLACLWPMVCYLCLAAHCLPAALFGTGWRADLALMAEALLGRRVGLSTS